MNAPSPTVVVCAGAGGVGKTTTSAALALAAARAGHRALVVTVDPAKRLLDALGLEPSAAGAGAQPAEGFDTGPGTLDVFMVDAREDTSALIERLFAGAPGRLEALQDNRVVEAVRDALAGMHDLAAIGQLGRLAAEGRWTTVIIDTAPTAHALDLVDLPRRVLGLVDGRAARTLAKLARPRPTPKAGRSRLARVVGWGTQRLAAPLDRAFGMELIVQTADLLGVLAEPAVRDGIVSLARDAERWLQGTDTRLALVAAPHPAALDALVTLRDTEAGRALPPRAIVLNRAPAARTLEVARALEVAGTHGATPPLHQAVRGLADAEDAAVTAAHAARGWLSERFPDVPLVPLGLHDASRPEAVVEALAAELAHTLDARVLDLRRELGPVRTPHAA